MPKESEFTVPGDHPALKGHFPGNPIVPAAVLMSEVVDRIMIATGSTVEEVLVAKFPTVLKPEQVVHIKVHSAQNSSIVAVCTDDEFLYARLVVRVAT